MKIYTKTGDEGTTSLIGGTRASKDDPRVEAYGTVDELAAHLALLGDFCGGEHPAIVQQIAVIQQDLVALMAELARPVPSEKSKMESEKLEQWIDAFDVRFTGFVVPGGDVRSSQAHVCRTVCRRAERRAVTAGADGEVIKYLNRLSDWCFAVSIYLHKFAKTL